MKPKMRSLKRFYGKYDIKMSKPGGNWVFKVNILLFVIAAFFWFQNRDFNEIVEFQRHAIENSMRIDTINQHLLWFTNKCRHENTKRLILEDTLNTGERNENP